MHPTPTESVTVLGRRAFLKHGALFLGAAACLSQRSLSAADPEPILKIGLLTDLHHADKPSKGSRYYRDTLGKLEAAGQWLQPQTPDLVIELGDLIDAAPSVQTELSWLTQINTAFRRWAKEPYYVLGNHCVETLTKDEFLGEVGQTGSWMSFDRKGFHIVLLDACFRSDGAPYGRNNSDWKDANLPLAELDWLRDDLKQHRLPTLVMIHQRLDVNDHHAVRNHAAVRQILEQSGQVLAVFQGHSHKNDYRELNGIHYCTLRAMIEGQGLNQSGASLLSLTADHGLILTGFEQQTSHRWPSNRPATGT